LRTATNTERQNWESGEKTPFVLSCTTAKPKGAEGGGKLTRARKKSTTNQATPVMKGHCRTVVETVGVGVHRSKVNTQEGGRNVPST